MTWDRFGRLWRYFAPPIRICHDYPSSALIPEPEAGAQCISSARWDLCEGCQVTGIPIATNLVNNLSTLIAASSTSDLNSGE